MTISVKDIPEVWAKDSPWGCIVGGAVARIFDFTDQLPSGVTVSSAVDDLLDINGTSVASSYLSGSVNVSSPNVTMRAFTPTKAGRFLWKGVVTLSDGNIIVGLCEFRVGDPTQWAV